MNKSDPWVEPVPVRDGLAAKLPEFERAEASPSGERRTIFSVSFNEGEWADVRRKAAAMHLRVGTFIKMAVASYEVAE